MELKTYTLKPKTVQAVQYKGKPLEGITEVYNHIDNPHIQFGTDVVTLPTGVKRVYSGNMIILDETGENVIGISNHAPFEEAYEEVKKK